MTPAEILKLQSLAEQGKLRDLAIYAKFAQRYQASLGEINELESQTKRKFEAADITVIARWQRWADDELRRLNDQAQLIEIDKEAARNVAIKSAAKVQALEYLLKDARKAAIMLSRRRAEQNGMPPDA